MMRTIHENVKRMIKKDKLQGRSLVCDNAPWHRGKDLKQYVKDENLDLTYLPPYSPDLNPIEKLLSYMTRKVFEGGRVFEN